MSAHRLTVEIDRIRISGVSLTAGAADRIGKRVQSELTRMLAEASWPDQARRTHSISIGRTSPIPGAEHALVDMLVTGVMQALGASMAGGVRNG